MRLGVNAAVVRGEVVPGDVEIADGAVQAVGLHPAGRRGTAVPGFVDVQINGIAGVDFLHADAKGYAAAGSALLEAGVVAFTPTFISSPHDLYADAFAAMAGHGAAGPGQPLIAGVHLEGPFLSPTWAGAHATENLRLPDEALVSRLLALGPVAMVTLAPELPGALDLVTRLADAGILVSCGHCDAPAELAHRAFDAGAQAITHVHNAHRRWAPRDPGPAGAALARTDVTIQAICDGVHLAPETVELVRRAAGSRLCLVSDASAAATLRPGNYALGDRPIHVRDGVARTADGRLAGSVATLDECMRNLVAAGASLPAAVHAASTAPSRLLGRDDLGELAPGRPAHVVVLDNRLRPVRTLVGGIEGFAAA